MHVSTHWKNIVLWCCSDGGSVEHSPSSPTEVDDLLELSLDTSDSEDDDWWNNQHVIECTSKVKARTVTGARCPRSRLTPDLIIYIIIPVFYGSSVSVCAASWLAQRLIHRHIICVVFLGVYSVKEAVVSVMVVCSSALVYNNTLSLLSFIIPHRLKHCLNLIHCLTHELSVTHPNTSSSVTRTGCGRMDSRISKGNKKWMKQVTEKALYFHKVLTI